MFTQKQKEVLRCWQLGNMKRINILQGAVRSGKTYISLILWAFMVADMPKDATFLMAGKTLSTLKRNVLEPLQDLVGKTNFKYSVSKKEGKLFERRIYLEGVGDARSENKIRGMTLDGAYCDELSLFPESFFSMLLSRLSKENAKLLATTNPDSPNHWLMKNYLSRDDLDLMDVRFTIDDNDTLPKAYVDALKKEFSGVFYKRFILGEWVVASGLVYPMFDTACHVKKHTPSDSAAYYISVDYGTVNPCSMGLWAVENGNAHRVGEYYYNSRTCHALKTDEEFYAALCSLAGDKVIQYVVVDPSAASFIEVIRRHGRFSVRKANNRVLDGIRRVAALLKSNRLSVSPTCKDTIREFGEYAWDESAAEDKVVKQSDHAMDDIRYFVMSVLPMQRN